TCTRERFCFGRPNGTPCDDGNACTTADACQGGFCTGGPGVECPACTSCDPAAGCIPHIRFVCRATTDGRHAILLVKNVSDDSRDAVRWRWALGLATSLADLGSPTLSDGCALRLDDTTSPPPALPCRATAAAA